MNADVILKNGIVQTMVGTKTAEAVAICGTQIHFVGSTKDALSFCGPDTQVIDLAGRMVTPGFIDGHTHDVTIRIGEGHVIYLNETPADLSEYRKVVRDFLETHPQMEMVYGFGLDLNAFPNAQPDNQWLNELAGDRPVLIHDLSYHGCLLSRKALEICGITKELPPPDGATIYKNKDGELTGYLCDAPSLLRALPELKYTKEMYRAAFLRFQEEAHSYGITAIDNAGPVLKSEECWEILHEMERSNELQMRVNVPVWYQDENSTEDAEQAVKRLSAGRAAYTSDYQRITQAKVMVDGVPEGKSAYLIEPYAPEAGEAPDYRSSPIWPQEKLNRFVEILDKAGNQVQIHAMGDGAVKMALDSFERAQRINGARDARHMIAHVTLIRPEDIQRMAELKVIGTMQPLWWYYDPNFSSLEQKMFGDERFASEYHIREMMDAGIRITGSIDYPIQLDYQPLHGIEVGVTQCSPYPGEKDDPAFVRNAKQGVTPYEMLQCYTVNGAFEMCMEDLIGTVEPGKKADLVVLGQNILTCPSKEIADTPVEMTIFDGKIVYCRDSV